MKFYKLKIYYDKKDRIKEKIFPKGKEFKNLKEYFSKNNMGYIEAFDKYNREIYIEFFDGEFCIRLLNDENEEIYRTNNSGEVFYPAGKEVYDKYILKCKKEKLEKILNKGKTE